jgi:uncharacterized membrane protein
VISLTFLNSLVFFFFFFFFFFLSCTDLICYTAQGTKSLFYNLFNRSSPFLYFYCMWTFMYLTSKLTLMLSWINKIVALLAYEILQSCMICASSTLT